MAGRLDHGRTFRARKTVAEVKGMKQTGKHAQRRNSGGAGQRAGKRSSSFAN